MSTYRRDELARLDADLAEPVRASTRAPVRAALVGFVGVGLLVAIDWLSNGRPSPLLYAAAALCMAVVDATVLGGAWAHKVRTLQWARVEQMNRDRDRERVVLPERSRARMLVTAEEIGEDGEGEADDDRG